MTYKIACGVLLLGLIFLGTRMKVALSKMDEIEESVKEMADEKKQLEEKLSDAQKANSFLLEENARIILENNEVKFVNNKKQPLIIYKNVPQQKINDAASESYIGILEERYSPNK
jgi:regulator of replication initiation timing